MRQFGAKMDMAQSNVAREPSMDEILASIRKIIESNEMDAVGISRDTSVGQMDGRNDQFEEVAAPVASARIDPVIPDVVPEAPKNMSLADIAARVRSASEQRYAENTAAPTEFSPLTAPPIRSPYVEEQAAPVERRADPRSVAVMPQKAPERLLSEESGQHVARSFGDLAAAMNSSPRKTFDEIAEEMLRPMLTEWLDDNLPKLVERLVREEIERVARGPRR